MDGQISMFLDGGNDIHLVDKAELKSDITLDSYIGVDIMRYERHEVMSWRDVFMGYQHLKVMTYSFGLPFITDVMKYFDTGEVIVGSKSQVHDKAAELLATQQFVTNYVCDSKELQGRIREGTFHMYVAKDIISHAKVYLLSSDSGKTRVVLASANMSERGWNGDQLENYEICDDRPCYDIWNDAYEIQKEMSTDEIAYDAKRIDDNLTNIDQLPIFKNIKQHNSGLVIHEVEESDETIYAFSVQKKSARMNELLRSCHIKPNRQLGGTLFDIKRVKKMAAFANKKKDDNKKQEIVCPQLILNYDDSTLTINDREQDLHPDREAVTKDICRLYEYIDGFNGFTGDTTDLKRKVWMIINHMFLSPFLAKLRYEGSKIQLTGRRFPMYLVISGPRDNGKSSLIKMIQKLMLDLIPLEQNQKNFSNQIIKAWNENIKGCPILIDDVNNTYWKYAKDIVKTDNVLIEEHLTNHPTYVITSNDIESVLPEVKKRVIVLYLNNQVTTDKAASDESKVASICSQMHNAFYREYMGRMFPKVQEMIEMMQEDALRPMDWNPDIYNLSANVIMDIINDCGLNLPEELQVFTWDVYMGEIAISRQAVNSIRDLYRLSPELFKIDTKRNELIIDFKDYDNKTKALKKLQDELPIDVEKKVMGNKLTMKLDKIQEYAGITFSSKKSFWQWLMGD